jgi:predicted nuclease of restriction endonuclease-like (RecB) superfamily
MDKSISPNSLFENIRSLLLSSRQDVLRYVNTTMVHTYFEIGRMIVEDEQRGNIRADYGEKTIVTLSEKLSKEFGNGFSVRNIKLMKQFYLVYGKGQTLSAQSKKSSTLLRKFELSWSHYVFLMRQDEPIGRFYEIEAIENNWSLRELERQFNSMLYERLSLSRDKKKILELNKKGQVVEIPEDLIKDPYIFEFLGFKEDKTYSESDLESKLIENLKRFLLELGKGYTFVARQQRISFDEEHFFIDLVFYNRLLRCFIVFDIKTEELKHQDLGQLQMYVNYYDRIVKTKDENKTIGILLCTDKNNAVVKMTLPEDNDQVFASKYRLYLPTKEELLKQLGI